LATPVDITKEVRTSLRPLQVLDLGLIAYEECWDLQNRLAAALHKGEGRETLLLLEHPHTYTCGRRGGRDHILASEDVLELEGVTVLDVDRGGDVTYHGPGQLVAYPIIDLSHEDRPIDYPGYVRDLEQVLVGSLADFDISAYTIPDFSGAWVRDGGQDAKIAAIGVKVDARGITTHGIALNVTTDLRYFANIVPCGITTKGVTSMRRLLPSPPTMTSVKECFTRHFAERFGFADGL